MMTTGYVHPVADGEITDLRTFALRCSRAMMACVTMRDEPMSQLPPRQFPLDLAYYEGRLAEAEARLDLLSTETAEQRNARVEAEYQKELQGMRAFDDKEVIEMERVKAMRDKVRAWAGGPEGLKDFMLEQLDRCIKDDNGTKLADYVKRHDPDEMWRQAVDAVGKAHADIAREKALHANRNAWLDQLWASLPE